MIQRFLFTLLLLAQSMQTGDPGNGQFQADVASRKMIEARLRDSSQDNAKRGAILKRMFRDSGCTPPRLTEQAVAREALPNVLCTLPEASSSTIIVGAHFDHVRDGEGIVDNWSGASLLPSFYAALCRAPRRHTFMFIGFTDEEGGLVGSKWYAAHLTDTQSGHIRAMINIDSVGLGSTKIFLNHSDPILFHFFEKVASRMKVDLGVVNVRGAGEDSEPFQKRHIPTLMIHSVTPATWHILHSPQDTIAAIDLMAYYDTYRLIVEYLADLDRELD